MIRRLVLAAAVAASLAGCSMLNRPSAPQGPAGVHYVIGDPYQTAGYWHYPREQFDYNETGLAAVTQRNSGVTADGEVADAQAMAAAHPTLQLPAIAKVTNLDTGLQVLVRINDRGPEARGRLIALTPRVFQLLGGAGQPAMRVRVQVMDTESRRLAADLHGGEQATLAVTAAPQAAVQSEQLAPPPGAKLSTRGHVAPAAPRPVARVAAATAAVPLRLPEQLFRVPARPGALYVEAGAFAGLQYAEILRARLGSLGAQTSTSYDAPRERAYRVRIGPLPSAAVADGVLARVTQAGVEDARIVAE